MHDSDSGSQHKRRAFSRSRNSFSLKSLTTVHSGARCTSNELQLAFPSAFND
jgi:hypothetical protein